MCSALVSLEDILDEVSGLTVNSPDASLEEGPQPILQSPRGQQEDKTCMGTGQRVGCGKQHNFDNYAHIHRHAV